MGVKKAGHTGTLDPGVAGVLPVCVGRATRLAEYIAGSDKAYRAEITFGVATDTQDGFGEVVAEADASHLTRGDVAYALTRFHGPIEQVPPMVSAATAADSSTALMNPPRFADAIDAAASICTSRECARSARLAT